MIYPISLRRLSEESAFVQENAPRYGTWRGNLLWIEGISWGQLLRGEIPTSPPPADPGPLPPSTVEAVPRDHWPRIVRNLAKRATPADRGAGDTLERLLGKSGKAYKRVFMAITGKGCGCNNRQRWMNQRFPYDAPIEPPV